MLKKTLRLVPSQPAHYQAKMVFIALLCSLGMFFLATMWTYILIRTQWFLPIRRVYEPLVLPWSFLPSTGFLLLTSFFLERACWFVRRERQFSFRRSLWYAALASVGFVWLQQQGMEELVSRHFSTVDGSTKFFGISFVLVLLHALHVVGGMVYLGYIIWQSRRGKYDHERHWAVSHCAQYWHFLDVVWIGMIVTFLWAG